MPPTNRITPQEGQESVWDYPRPPLVESMSERIRIIFNGIEIANTVNAYRVLETSHPPSYYLPQADLEMEYFTSTPRRTFCEFKGEATYWTINVGDQTAGDAAWMYTQPSKGYEIITNHLAFYASRMQECYVGDERVQAQSGDFYGGWITNKIVGPFKGGAGTWGW